MRRVVKYAAIGLASIVVLALLAFWIYGQWALARATGEAVAAARSTDRVTVETEPYLTFRPAHGKPRLGVIFYPGASCDIRGYAPLFQRIAERGYFIAGVPMPFNFAALAPNRADAVQERYPEIDHWVIAGHSLGGAMASYYADHNEKKLDGVILWDAYPPRRNSLADSELPVWNLHRARPDGRAPDRFEEMRDLFPASSVWIPIPGGIHMYFGSFDGGAFVEDWKPEITRDAQLDAVVTGTLNALLAIERANGSPTAGG